MIHELKEKLTFYQQLNESGVRELQFEKLQNHFLVSVLSEVEELAKKKVNHNLIKQVIENAKQRHFIDKMIHADLIFNER
jgi:SOS response regulatory protein OraA/RecX